MRTRLILVLADESATPEINIAIGEVIKANGAGWWHWYQHTWLIYDWKGQTIQSWQAQLQAVKPEPTFMLFNADTGQWSGFTKKAHYDWMYTAWDKKD